MQILTKKIKEKLIQNHVENNIAEDEIDFKPVLKLFGGSSCTWLLSELDPENNIAFGLCDLGQDSPELGSVSMDELMAIRFPPFGLPIERDRHFKAKKSLGDYADEARKLNYIKS